MTLTLASVAAGDPWASTAVPWATSPGTGFAHLYCATDGFGVPHAYLAVGDTAGTGSGCGAEPGAGGSHGLTLADYTCSPFHMHWTVNPTICTDFAAAGYTDFYVDGPAQDPGTCCKITFAVLGCAGPNVDPDTGAPILLSVLADVSIWTNSSKATLVASGTTATTLDVITAGTYYYEVSSHGFVTATGTQAFTCFSTINVTLTVAIGYTCVTSCANPVANTLHGTHSVLGAITYTRNVSGTLGDGWYATLSYSYPGCFCCASKTVTVTCYLDTSFNYQESWKST